MAGSIDQGMFNFDSVMKQFYDYQPGKDDTEGRAIKNNFQANMIQSGFDSQMAKDMAYSQSQIAQENMTHAADLEARNTSTNMQQEFNYGMQSMGAQFEYQDKFANNQFDRDLGTLGATGEQERLTQSGQGSQDRLTAVVQGEQSKGLAAVQGEYGNQQATIGAEAAKYGAKQTADASKYQSDASVSNTQTQAASQDKQTDDLTYVDQWLDTLPAADSEDFREFAEVTPSVIEIWVYAGILALRRNI
jgi:hypothetical protein